MKPDSANKIKNCHYYTKILYLITWIIILVHWDILEYILLCFSLHSLHLIALKTQESNLTGQMGNCPARQSVILDWSFPVFAVTFHSLDYDFYDFWRLAPDFYLLTLDPWPSTLDLWLWIFHRWRLTLDFEKKKQIKWRKQNWTKNLSQNSSGIPFRTHFVIKRDIKDLTKIWYYNLRMGDSLQIILFSALAFLYPK